jgi:hypothetical protein
MALTAQKFQEIATIATAQVWWLDSKTQKAVLRVVMTGYNKHSSNPANWKPSANDVIDKLHIDLGKQCGLLTQWSEWIKITNLWIDFSEQAIKVLNHPMQ